jgi:hypothetical protein
MFLVLDHVLLGNDAGLTAVSACQYWRVVVTASCTVHPLNSIALLHTAIHNAFHSAHHYHASAISSILTTKHLRPCTLCCAAVLFCSYNLFAAPPPGSFPNFTLTAEQVTAGTADCEAELDARPTGALLLLLLFFVCTRYACGDADVEGAVPAKLT